MSNELEKTIQNLRERGVRYVHFCNTWYSDEDGFHAFGVFDAQFKEIDSSPYRHSIDFSLQYSLREHVFLFHGKPVVDEEIINEVLLFDVETNELFQAGFASSPPDIYADRSDFIFSSHPNELMQAARADAKTSIELLERLAKHPDEFVRLNVAQNPTTPKSLFKVLIGDVSLRVSEVAQVKLKDPEEVSRLKHELQGLATKHQNQMVLESAAKHQWAQIRLIAASYPNIASEFLELLQNDPNWEIQLAVLNHPNTLRDTKTKILQDLAHSPFLTQIQLAEHLFSPPALLELLARHSNDERVLYRIAANPNTSSKPLDFLISTHQGSVLWVLCENPKTSAKQLHYFAGSHTRFFLEKPHRNLAPQTRRMLEEFNEYAKRNDLSDKEIRLLNNRLKDLWWTDSFYTIARQANCPPEILAEYFETGKALPEVARNPNTSREVLEKLALNPWDYLSQDAKKQLKERFGVE
jgi:hypothetical protein